MKISALIAAGVIGALALTACGSSTNDADSPGNSADAAASDSSATPTGDGGVTSTELNIYAWSGEIPQEVIDAFTDETGIKVTMDAFDSNETMISKLAVGNSGYDIVEPSQYAVQQLVGQELIEPLDKSQLEGFDNISATFVDPTYDPGNEYSIPWVWGTTGLMYNSTCTNGEEITSWKSMMDPKWKGKMYMLDNMLAAYIMGLQVNGYPANSTDEQEIATATQTLIDQKELLAGYNSTNYVDLVVNGDACIAEAWGGTSVAKAVEDNDDVHYVIPSEGGSLWVDGLAIPKGAPHLDAAYAFLNFILRPDIAAIATNDGGMASANSKATDFVDDKGLLTNAAVYPTDEQVAEADFITDPGPAMKFFQDGWTKVKAS